jgi:hypothetical protein
MLIECLTADAEFNFRGFDTGAYVDESSLVEDRFATMPVLTVSPLTQPLSEEELHTSFEQAISDRLMIVNQRLSLASGPLTHTYTQRFQVHTEPLGHTKAINSAVYPPAPEQQHHAVPTKADWRRLFIYGCLALMFTLIGFDLMGVLMLHAH